MTNPIQLGTRTIKPNTRHDFHVVRTHVFGATFLELWARHKLSHMRKQSRELTRHKALQCVGLYMYAQRRLSQHKLHNKCVCVCAYIVYTPQTQTISDRPHIYAHIQATIIFRLRLCEAAVTEVEGPC